MSLTMSGKTILILSTFMAFQVIAKTCILPSPLTLQLILEYAEWQSWEQVILFDDISSFNCVFSYVKPLMECFSKRGISISLQSATNPNIPDALKIRTHRVGSVVLLDGLNLTSSENVIQVASQKFLFNYYVSWFMVTSKNTDAIIDTILRNLNIGIDSEVIVATSPLPNNAAALKYGQKYRDKTCPFLRRYGNRFLFTEPPERHNVDNVTINLNYVILEERSVSFYLVHTYKIRNSDNTSLVTRYLGFWNPGSHTLVPPVSVKLRNNFNGIPIIFGLLNGTNEGQTESDEVEGNEIAPLVDFATFLTNSLNASIELVPYEKLGILTNKVWSNLLGDVVTGTVDIGLGYITINDERMTDMAFSHPLVRYMRNIYYRPLETGTMRDIFLQPFNNKLLGYVAATYLILLIGMVAVIYSARVVLRDRSGRHCEIGEAPLWCISIMCMQGSPWTPRSPSGKTLMLFSLMFALVTYNAYAGFITSILSVQATGIKSITDLLFNNFKLGYSVSDDEYIRDVNDSNLRQLYIKAFNNRESRLETTTGLMKAIQGRYGFFVSATLARQALRTTLIQERCNIKELSLPQTFTVVALPMANSCAYKKIINLNILRIQEHGVLDRVTERMLPEMPRCMALTTFHSARLADVYSAFFILIAGLITATSIGILERIWKNRKRIQKSLSRYIRHLISQIHFHSPDHHHHHHHNDQYHQHSDTLLYSYPENNPPTRDSKLHNYNAPYWNMLENHARQVAFVGLRKLNISEKSKDSSLRPQKRKSIIHKRTSWSSFVSKKKIRSAEKNVSSQVETKQDLPLCN